MKGIKVILLICSLAQLACSSSGVCDDDSQSYLVARFRTLVEGEITDTILDSLSLYGIREGLPDSLIYNMDALNRIQIPLDPHGEDSRFVLSNQGKSDTLTISHSSEAYLISYECGFAARFTLKKFVFGGGLVRDVEVQESMVDAELIPTNEAHIWIYF